MRPHIFVPILLLIGAACAAARDQKPDDTPLPKSCTLRTMSPPDRAAHLERLRLLKEAASGIVTSNDGFAFKINLQTMSLDELQKWGRAEVGCCAFLQIKSEVIEAGKLASVRVVCPSEMKKETMAAFGLKR